jgi:hypothetical protein
VLEEGKINDKEVGTEVCSGDYGPNEFLKLIVSRLFQPATVPASGSKVCGSQLVKGKSRRRGNSFARLDSNLPVAQGVEVGVELSATPVAQADLPGDA